MNTSSSTFPVSDVASEGILSQYGLIKPQIIQKEAISSEIIAIL